MIIGSILVVAFLLIGAVAWAIHKAPVIDERNCTKKYLLYEGRCEGPCERLPPCSMEVEL